MEYLKTPQGDNCIGSIDPQSRLGELILKTPKGSFQTTVVMRLLDHGYVIGYLADGGPLRGRARNYQSKYERSLFNLMNRIKEELNTNSPFKLVSGSVGPKGGFGYYLSEE
jgi:hypothetical protein